MKNITERHRVPSKKKLLAETVKSLWLNQHEPDGRRLTLPEICKMLAPENWKEIQDLVQRDLIQKT